MMNSHDYAVGAKHKVVVAIRPVSRYPVIFLLLAYSCMLSSPVQSSMIIEDWRTNNNSNITTVESVVDGKLVRRDLKRIQNVTNDEDITSELTRIFRADSAENRCTCRSCTDEQWNVLANGISCGNRINHLLQAESNLYPTQRDACVRIASMEYPLECGYCNPLICDDKPPPTEPSNYCGNCISCTPEVYKTKTPDPSNPVSCGARITWLMSHNGMSEMDACSAVSQQFSSICGPACDPARCTKGSNPIPTPVVVVPTGQPPKVPQSLPVRQPISSTPRPSKTILDGSDGEMPTPFSTSKFGTNTIFIDNSLSTEQIQGLFDDIYNRQVNNEMGTDRYALLFLPGTYGSSAQPLMLKIGYYTDVAGLGGNPNDVVINGKIEIYNRCFEADPYKAGKFIPTSNGQGSLCFALNNFWRSLSNLSINIMSLNQDQCRSRAMFWAVSQATSMRRVDLRGGEVSLMDYCTGK